VFKDGLSVEQLERPMNIHEYQGKMLLRDAGVPVLEGVHCTTVDEALNAYDTLGSKVVAVKSQIHAGGRGKGTMYTPGTKDVVMEGGVKIAFSKDEVKTYASNILGNLLVTIQTGGEGKIVNNLYIEAGCDIAHEYYLALLVDRDTKSVLIMASTEGGMDIEEVAANSPEDLIKIYISPSLGLESKIITQAIKDANLNLDYIDELHEIISKLYKLFTEGDCDLVEVNPLAITNQGVSALDSKVSLDMNAIYRHDDFKKYEEEIPIPESEKFAKSKGLNFIKLDGSVGIIGNGAGLVMSTLDVVAEHGGKAANFCDIGGGAKAETVTAALEVLESEEEVTSVLINIFGGITRCDLVAEGIVEATKGKVLKWPLIVRLDGTNSKEGLEILSKNANEKIIISESMDDAAKAAVEGGK